MIVEWDECLEVVPDNWKGTALVKIKGSHAEPFEVTMALADQPGAMAYIVTIAKMRHSGLWSVETPPYTFTDGNPPTVSVAR